MRLLNTIANDLQTPFSDNYIGVVNNNDDGRMMFKKTIVGYLLDVQQNSGIQNFDSENDVEVLAGEDSDAIVVNIGLYVGDAVEKIYVRITVH